MHLATETTLLLDRHYTTSNKITSAIEALELRGCLYVNFVFAHILKPDLVQYSLRCNITRS